jgi:hypothetical protein
VTRADDGRSAEESRDINSLVRAAFAGALQRPNAALHAPTPYCSRRAARRSGCAGVIPPLRRTKKSSLSFNTLRCHRTVMWQP